MPTPSVPFDPAAEPLAEIVTMRHQLCDENVAAENQASHLDDATAAPDCQASRTREHAVDRAG
jgi:hypothetical protein